MTPEMTKQLKRMVVPDRHHCTGCGWGARCDHTGQCCDAWRRWFTAAYDSIARQLRAAVEKGRANGQSD